MTSTVTSEIEVANLALGLVKEPGIGSFDDPTPASRWFKKHYIPSRHAVLARHRWNFAQTRAALVADSVAPLFDWSYAYTLPSDCMRMYPPTVDGRRASALLDHEVEGGKVLCNKSGPLYLRYVQDVENEALLDPLFVEAFVFYLASNVAHVLSGKRSLIDQYRRAFEGALSDARSVDAMQGTPDPVVTSDYISTRQQEWPYS
ncbi:MAG: hypothetical protein JKY34_09260 [Kordiimonadaceae bacterium]|nr:hypothetical protein [Kordiimonadaceae bacterium]